MPRRATRNPIPESIRLQVEAAFNDVLACIVDARSLAEQAHWIVAGPSFDGRHATFGAVADALGGYADTIAEYIVAQGGSPAGTVRAAAVKSVLPELSRDAISGLAVSSGLADALALLLAKVVEAEARVNALPERLAGDVMIEIGRGVQKWLWQVEAVLQAPQ